MNKFKKLTAFFLVVFLIFGSLTFSASATAKPTGGIIELDSGSDYSFTTCYDPVSQTHGTLLKLDPLPDLPDGARVVGAECQVYWGFPMQGPAVLHAYQVTSDWSYSNFVMPSISSQPEDTWAWSYGEYVSYAVFDITNAVANWYETGNYGIFINVYDLWVMDYLYISYVID